MNATSSGNGDNGQEIARLHAEIDSLLLEISRLSDECDTALTALDEAHREIDRLHARITELEGGQA